MAPSDRTPPREWTLEAIDELSVIVERGAPFKSGEVIRVREVVPSPPEDLREAVNLTVGWLDSVSFAHRGRQVGEDAKRYADRLRESLSARSSTSPGDG